jgi:uncharacterized membrane protein YcaP (DUF421 family)
MEIVLRAGAMYVLILAFMRLSGKRTIAQITMFDFILLLIVSEATQQALLGDDYSITGGALAVLTLILLDRLSDTLSSRSRGVDRALNDGAVVLVEHGQPHEERLRRHRLRVDDVLLKGRSTQGVERLDQIKYAVLERTGEISVIKAD